MIRKAVGLELAGSLHSALSLTQYAAQLQPDIVLLDIDKSDQPFERALPLALPRIPSSVPVVALVDDPSPNWAAQVLRSGVKAILPRDSDISEILPAIQAAYAGFVFLDPEVSASLASRIPTLLAPSAPALDDLTPREIEVLRMLAEGLSNREVASRLGISDHTVKFHISSILDKLGASSRTEAVTMGIRMGIILL
jgi:DNA-binding NarL/FixJ family response regulator